MFRLAPGCVKFGDVCGYAPGGVAVYSNGNEAYFSGELSAFDGIPIGLKYQSIEFARRWLLQRKGLWLPDVAFAAHVGNLMAVEDAATGEPVKCTPLPNGREFKPVVDSLLVYPADPSRFIVGHVAAIVEVSDTWVRVAAQNAHFHKWKEGEYWSDEIPIIVENGTYTLKDKRGGVPIGWVTFDTPSRPLDAPPFNNFHPKYRVPVVADPMTLKRVTFVPQGSQGKAWLDTTNPAQAKFIETFGLDANRSRLDESEANYYTVNRELWFACARAGLSLHNLSLEATKKVLASDELMAVFGLDKKYWGRIRRSFETQPYAITGRFDFVVDAEGKQLKTFEYNADSASTLLECAVIQDKWAEHVGVAQNSWSPGARIGLLLEHAWREAIAGGVVEKGSKVHFFVDNDNEEQYTALYVAEKAQAAGLTTELCVMFDALEWRGGRVVDKSSGTPVKTVWKTWAWETAISDATKAEAERPAGWTPKDGDAVRLCDVLLGDENIHVFEPMWKLIPGNKAIMAVMSEMAPDHPNLLRTEWKLSEELRQKGYARKPIVGRCGLNVTVHAPGGEVLHETHGQFGNREMVYQELFQLPKRDDYYAILGGWMIGAIYAGTGLREDKSIVTNVESPFSAIRIKVPFKPKLVTHENATDDHLNRKDKKEDTSK